MIEYSDNAKEIYRRLYLAEGEETPQDTHERVARFIANTDQEYEDFKFLLDNKIFRPNTPTLIAAGIKGNNEWDKNLSGCFVLGMDDSMESIIEVWSTCSKIYAGGAGSGIPITNLREKGSHIGKNKGQASGPLKYLHVIESVANTVKSGGRHRRASNLASAKYNHPDIFEIIDAKLIEDNLRSFNISILVDDWFMKRVKVGRDFDVDLITPNGGNIVTTVNGMDIWKKIVENAHKSGDPGLLFYDTANRVHPYPDEEIASSNPCGEVLLPPWSICNLGSINLSKCISYEKNNNPYFDFSLLIQYSEIATRFMDNVIDKNGFVHEKFKERALKERPIGLGIMSLSDVLFELGIAYNSVEARDLFSTICKTLTTTAFETSVQLAKEKGSIEIKNKEHFIGLLRQYTGDEILVDNFRLHGIRNSSVSSIAPTGSISISSDCSYSFEPCFALVWTKELAETHELMYFVNPIFEKWVDEEYVNSRTSLTKEALFEEIMKHNGSIQNIIGIPDHIKEIFVTAHDITYLDKLKMQQKGQEFITLGISSTCNLKNSATVEDVNNAFINAWEYGLKGITVYRDGCKSWQPVNFGSKQECKEPEVSKEYIRPIKSTADHYEFQTPNGKIHVTICRDDDQKIFQVLIRVGKQGSLTNLLLDALSRCISKSLQYNVPLSVFAKTLRDNKDSPFWVKLNKNDERSTQVESIVDLLGIIFDMVSQENAEKVEIKVDNGNDPTYIKMERCPSCGEYSIIRDGSCKSGRCIREECMFTSCG